MSSKWGKSAHQQAGDSGILRKADGPDKIEELLVFGYACKLFRDDEKALDIDQGKHLIPWMGDDSLKIDRYDGRAALSDLSMYETSAEGYDTARWLGLTDAERRVEQLCDEERYRALHTNEDEEELYREEELKRLHQQLSNEKNYGQVSFNYDGVKPTAKNEDSNETNLPENEEDDEPFVPPPSFDLPVNMTIPKTVKQNARIEKTAFFISQQGAQMEILLKAKQAGNPQFDFLSHDSSLHSYYRHILMAIKTGRLNCQPPPPKPTVPENEETEHYLHPSLAPMASRVESAPSIPNIAYKPSADCAYTMLISKIKGQTAPKVETPPPPPEPVQVIPTQPAESPIIYQQQVETPVVNNSTYNFPPNSTYIYNYQTGKYEPAPPPPPIPTPVPIQYQQVEYQQMPNSITYTAQPNEITKSAIIYNNEKLKPTPVINQSQPPPPPKVEEIPKKLKPTPLLPIAHYSSSDNSDNEGTEDEENATKAIINVLNYEVPPSDIQLIVDKMASYVARNGADFESIVRSKGDPRFSFLNDTHVYNAYYKHKLKVYGGVTTPPEEKVTEENDIKIANNKPNSEKSKKETDKSKGSEKHKKPVAPVSFSIKKSKDPDSVVAIEKSALLVEESSDEDGTSREATPPLEDLKPRNEKVVTENVQETLSLIPVPAEIGTNQSAVQAIKLPPAPDPLIELVGGTNTPITTPPPIDITDGKNQIIDIDDTIQELIDLTDDLEERRDQKRAEDKIKDKIAAAAREKMSSLSRNRELQIERKRRAAAFLNKIKPNDLIVNGSGMDTINEEPKRNTAEEDDLLKRIAEFDSDIANIEATKNDRSSEKHRHHKSSKKKRRKRSCSSESHRRDKRSKHRHRSPSERKSKRKYRSRSRSISRSSRASSSRASSSRYHSRSRSRVPSSSSHRRRHHHTDYHHERSSKSRTYDNEITSKSRKKHSSHKKRKEDKSSGEITSADSSYDSD